MRRGDGRAVRFLASFVCALLLSAGNVLCIVTAFDLEADIALLCAVCAGASLLFSLLMLPKRVLIGLGASGFIICLFMWLFRDAVAQSAVYTSSLVAQAYIDAFPGLSGLTLSVSLGADASASAIMCAIGIILSLLASWTVGRRAPLLPLVVVSAALLALCLMIVYTVPAVWALLPLLGAYALLLLTQRSRSRTGGGFTLTLCMIIPVALTLAVTLALVQPQSYEKPAWTDSIGDEIERLAEKYSIFRHTGSGGLKLLSPLGQRTLGSFIWDSNPDKVELGAVSPQSKTGAAVMEVQSDRAGPYYLRGSSLAVYSDNGWESLPDSAYAGAGVTDGLWLTAKERDGEMQIKTLRHASICYIPYYPTEMPEGASPYFDSYVENESYATDYSASYSEKKLPLELTPAYEAFVNEVYTQVPEETRALLADYIELLESYGGDVMALADEAARIVSSSARYSLQTPRMPEGEEFVHWFLTESDTGYCVHYATAAAVLLRCAGVPARYVTGYLVNAGSDGWTQVTQDDAHAWTEYYVNGYGWMLLEATPEAGAAEDSPSAETPEPAQPSSAPQEPEASETPLQPSANGVGSGSGGAEDDEKGPSLTWLLILPCFAAALLIRRWVLRAARRRAMTRGGINARALAVFRQIQRMARFAGEDVPEKLRETALKARFSSHTLTQDELKSLTDACAELRARLLADRRPARYILCRVVFCW